MKKTREMMSRGKTPGKGRWIEGYYVGKTPFELQGSLIATWNFNPDDKKAFGQLVTHLVIPETVGRCTGQPDKNGRTAFEDDLIKNFGDIGVIRYGEYKNPFNVISFEIYGEINEKAISPVDSSLLHNWYIDSIPEYPNNPELNTPVWTEEHIEELIRDYALLPREDDNFSGNGYAKRYKEED